MPRRRRHACEKRLYLLSAFSFQLLAPRKRQGSGGSAVVVASRGAKNIMRKLAIAEKIFAKNKKMNNSSTKPAVARRPVRRRLIFHLR